MAQTDNTATPATLATWKKNAVHTVTLSSGTVVEIKLPDLPQLFKSGQIPNELIDIAIGVTNGRKVTSEDIVQQADFYNKLSAWTVVSPKVTEDDFASSVLPFEDKEMIVEFATRQRDMDAVGHHLAGLEKVSSFREVRRIASQLASLED